MTDENHRYLTRRTALKAAGATTTAAVVGAGGLWFSTRGASAALTSSTLTGNSVSISGDGGDVTDFDLDATTTMDLSWEGFDANMNEVTFTLEARRTQVGTGSTATEANNNLAADTSTYTTIFTDTPTALSPGRNGSVTYTESDLATTFPFAIIDAELTGANVVGTLSDANIDSASLSLGTDGNYKESEITFTLSADLSSTENAQSITVTETGIMSFVVENIATDGDTGGTVDGSGSAA